MSKETSKKFDDIITEIYKNNKKIIDEVKKITDDPVKNFDVHYYGGPHEFKINIKLSDIGQVKSFLKKKVI